MKRALAAALLAAIAALSAPAGAQKAFIHDETAGRVQLMQSSKEALGVLSGMMAGQVRFSSARARTARRTLIRNTRRIEKAFRKQRLEPLSHAKPAIWDDWRGFTGLADAAAKAAVRTKPQDLARLRRTLPALMQACIACHDRFRTTPPEFTTH